MPYRSLTRLELGIGLGENGFAGRSLPYTIVSVVDGLQILVARDGQRAVNTPVPQFGCAHDVGGEHKNERRTRRKMERAMIWVWAVVSIMRIEKLDSDIMKAELVHISCTHRSTTTGANTI